MKVEKLYLAYLLVFMVFGAVLKFMRRVRYGYYNGSYGQPNKKRVR